MAEQVFVVSDLHLGGDAGFQMCGPEGQRSLAGFVRWVTAQHRAERVAHVVIAGDGVDFLAEAPSLAFTADEGEAARKLDAIFAHTRPVWDALAAHVAAGAKLTVMLGNHDIELSLPRPRRDLLARLGVGRVEILYDDEALRVGPLLVEHGNRYDDWNWVDHDQLRRVRRNLSRGERADFFVPQPGSQFVIEVMNAIKRDFPFVDLLKPEDAAVPPFLALLRPDLKQAMKDVAGTVRQALTAKLRSRAPGGDSTRAFAAEEDLRAGLAETSAMITLLDQLTGDTESWRALREGDPEATRGGTGAFFSLVFGASGVSRDRAAHLDKLREALRAWVGPEGEAFDLGLEAAQYLDAARRSAARGARVIVYGHTHLVKRVDLGGATYLNTGTWADLMRVPAAALGDDVPPEEALRVLGEFADDLSDHGRMARWRRRVPTFARVDLSDDLSLRGADVFRYREGAEVDAMRLPDGPVAF